MLTQKFTYLDDNNQEIECNVISMFSNGEKNYIAYTNDHETNGLLDIMVSKYKRIDREIKLIPVEDEEWEYINDYLQKNVFGSDKDEK